MNIGIVLDVSRGGGGGYDQALNALSLIISTKIEPFNLIVYTNSDDNIKEISELKIKSRMFNINFIDKIFYYFGSSVFFKKIINRLKINSSLEGKFLNDNIEILYFLTPSQIASYMISIPFIFNLWDLAHRDSSEFPEVYNYYSFDIRDEFYERVLKKAYRIIVDSEYMIALASTTYNINKNKLIYIPFDGSSSVSDNNINDENVLLKYNINSKYFYYPAQYWPHKNHMRILKAILYLKTNGVIVNLVCSGNDFGSKDKLIEFIRLNKLESQVKLLSYLSGSDVNSLYDNCIGVVMPTYFGPTNLPPIESWIKRKPLIYTNRFGMEFTGDACIPVDPDCEVSIGMAMNKILNSDMKNMINLGDSQLIKLSSLRINGVSKLYNSLKLLKTRKINWE